MPTLIINPRSGGGKAARFDLIAQCARRGIEPIVFEPGEDLAALAETAIRNGADAVGMAGGDGSQATVAAAAAEHGVGIDGESVAMSPPLLLESDRQALRVRLPARRRRGPDAA